MPLLLTFLAAVTIARAESVTIKSADETRCEIFLEQRNLWSAHRLAEIPVMKQIFAKLARVWDGQTHHVIPVWSSAGTKVEVEILGDAERREAAGRLKRLNVSPFRKVKASYPEERGVRITVSDYRSLSSILDFIAGNDRPHPDTKKSRFKNDALKLLKKIGANRLTVIVDGPHGPLATVFHHVRRAPSNPILRWLRVPGPVDLVVDDAKDDAQWLGNEYTDGQWLLNPAPWTQRGERLDIVRTEFVRKHFQLNLRELDTEFGDVASLLAWDLSVAGGLRFSPFGAEPFARSGPAHHYHGRGDRDDRRAWNISPEVVVAALKFLAARSFVWIDPAREEITGAHARPTGWITREQFHAAWRTQKISPGFAPGAGAQTADRLVGAVLKAESLGFVAPYVVE